MFSKILDNYRNNLPCNIPEQAVKSFAVNSRVSAIFSEPPKTILVRGTVSASATVVEAAIRASLIPFFDDGIISRVSSAALTVCICKKLTASLDVSYSLSSVLCSAAIAALMNLATPNFVSPSSSDPLPKSALVFSY